MTKTPTTLAQLIAVYAGIRTSTHRTLTDLHHSVGKLGLLSGIARTYQPKDEDGDQLPGESTRVQVNAADVLADVAALLTRQIDVNATIDQANRRAVGTIQLPGGGEIADVPVTTLMFLDKRLDDVLTFLRKLPVLDPGELWTFNDNANAWATEPIGAVRSKKVPRNHVLAAATDKHPAQVQLWHEDVPVGTWMTTKFSGAMPAKRLAVLIDRAERLQAEIRSAREKANMESVTDVEIGDKLFACLLADTAA